MEAGSEGEDNISGGGGVGGNQSPSDAAASTKKPKRQMKTPYQLETLERTYAMETYPTEATRAELSEKLGLTDRQLQMWFCHRRLKDKKEAAGMAAMKPRAPTAVGRRVLIESPRDEMMGAELGSDHGSGSGSGSGSSQFDNGEDISMVPIRYYESPRTIMERRVIACIEAQLGESLREDGPILGVEFDELPPGAFGAPIVTTNHQDRYRQSYDSKIYGQYDSEQIRATITGVRESVEPKIRSEAYGQVNPSYLYDSPVAGPTAKTLSLMQGNGHSSRDCGAEGQVSNVTILSHQGRDGKFPSPPRDNDFVTPTEDILQMERKRKIDEARIEKEVQANEKRIRKELEKQDLLRRKMEEQMKKEMERQERERRKEEQRLMREQQRREEKYQREEKREMERREKFMQREFIRAERRRQKEELRREREAAKQKAAMERAAVRKFVKESTELIEDERLELMELAASSKGLPSIVALDFETLQNLEAFRESLCEFPPKSVKLKKPFAIQPWTSSEGNIGNVLMAWKFCITFADVLGLWPFTLDEFVQAFHDYDSRLLAEIQIALLKLIIKDIEDVARTPSGGPGTNQYSAVNPEGGHPQLVEGAYLWGFDIRNWQKLLNPLTWPEILRQFALSAGFGPQLKKKRTEQACLNDNDETKGCEDIVSNLRSGAAAENAVAIMQEKGLSLQRRSRHRLTPGTVKFAAYHVLALEGSKGLNVIELAEKIQKSGLRDLTTSKTPEASISVALSRDPILFERIAPSTYNVRPAYRKDPADAEAILAAAKEKIQRFVNGFLAEQNVDEEERDDDSECDVAEGPEVDDVGTPDVNKCNEQGNEVAACSGNAKDTPSDDVVSQNYLNGVATGISNPDQEDAEIDESRSGEPWVQGLTEGEYSDLCVDERLNALVALVGVANEGNTIRVVLEDRLDAANALKKQMWAEAQLDKRRMKEENITKFHDSSFNVPAEGSQSPLVLGDNKNYEASVTPPVKDEASVGTCNVQNPFENVSAEKNLVMQDPSMAQQNGHTAERSRMQLKSFIGHKAEEMYVYRSLPLGQDRRRNRYWQFVASASCHDPGSGRIFMESPDGCWRLIDTEEAFDALLTSLDIRGIRESHLHIMLQKIEGPFRERVRRDSSCSNSNSHGSINRNEGAEVDSSLANAAIESPTVTQCTTNSDTCEPSSSFKIELGRNEMEKKNAVKRYQDLQIWMWKECFSSSNLCATTYRKKRCPPVLGICDSCLGSYTSKENCCPSCYRTFGKEKHCQDYVEIDPKNFIVLDSPHPLRVRLIKALLNFLEVSVPSEVLLSSWTEERRKTWGLKLQNSSSTEDLLQILIQFEGIIKRDYLSANFETTKELLGNCASGRNTANYEPAYTGYVAQLPWIPRTTAAVALRLFEFDSSISYVPVQKVEPCDEMKAEDFMKSSSRYTFQKDVQKVEPTESDRQGLAKAENWDSLGNTHESFQYKQVFRGRGSGRPRGRSQKGVAASTSYSGRKAVGQKETLAQILMQQRERTYGQKHGRGRRTVRRRRVEKKVVQEPLPGYSVKKGTPKISAQVSRRSAEEESVAANIGGMDFENDDDSDSLEAGDYDENARETTFGSGRWEAGFDAPDRNHELMETSDEDAGDSDDENVSEEDDDNMEEEPGMNDYDSDRLGGGNEDDADADSDSGVSGDYSD